MTEYETPMVDGPAVERVWTTVVAEVDGVVDQSQRGEQMLERVRWFAFRADAEAWLAEQEDEGFTPDGPTPLATWKYHGPSDSGSNAWACHARRTLPRT